MSREFSNLRLLYTTSKGHYFGAYANSKVDSKKGYDFFISTTEKRDWCECLGYVHGKLCYHISEAKKRFEVSDK